MRTRKTKIIYIAVGIAAVGICVALSFCLYLIFDCRMNHPRKITLCQSCTLPWSNTLYASVSDYLGGKEPIENNMYDTNKVQFIFANNPYDFNKDSWLFIYANGERIYEGKFSLGVSMVVPNQFDNSTLNFRVDILSPSKNGQYILYHFSDKSVMHWENEYNFIYAGFFPTNQNIDQIHFFPAKYSVIQ
jgi:hypothetical protein